MVKNTLLIGTRKGLVIYKLVNEKWKYQEVHFKGIPVSIAYVDERNGMWWACLDHGHWGVKLHRSNDLGKNWEEIPAPKYPEGSEIKDGLPASTKYIWAFAHGGFDRPNDLYLGTEPGGLFKSEDGGNNFELVSSLWNHPSRKEHWFGAGRDYAGIHSIVVDPRDSRHIHVGISVAGVFETKDGGATWAVKNKGLIAEFLPDHHAEVGHDPHILVGHPNQPDILWQQNHCGIFKTIDGANNWEKVSQNGSVEHFGFALALDPDDVEIAWVAPALSDEIRTAVNEKLCICKTENGGKDWTAFRNGLPQEACFDIVYRHSLSVNENWLAFGTTCGNLFVSKNKGKDWEVLNNYLPMVYSLCFG